ncbi:MAG TPA: hypothetical protein VMD09_18405 [Solirubrobacteraceae bacterium]|nr:hypothetical protein [Solirubrobacteraceae bacterium]
MNAQLSYQLAQSHQQELHRQAAQARAAREASGPSWFSALRHRIAGIGSVRPELQAQPPAQRPLAGGVGRI